MWTTSTVVAPLVPLSSTVYENHSISLILSDITSKNGYVDFLRHFNFRAKIQIGILARKLPHKLKKYQNRNAVFGVENERFCVDF